MGVGASDELPHSGAGRQCFQVVDPLRGVDASLLDVPDGTTVVVDAERGRVEIAPGPAQLAELQALAGLDARPIFASASMRWNSDPNSPANRDSAWSLTSESSR